MGGFICETNTPVSQPRKRTDYSTMSATAAMLASVEEIKAALQIIQTLALTAWPYPESCSLTNGSSLDYLIVGCGSAGSVVANRLSAESGVSVGVFEAGGYPPYESDMPGLFPLLPRSPYDYNFVAENDDYAAQNLINKSVRLMQGKMLGGTSSLHHMAWTQGDAFDYDQWADITGDSSWNYSNMTKYLRRSEKLLVQSILNSSYAQYHGDDGWLKITKEPNSANTNYLNSFQELGHQIREDLSGEVSLGFSELLLSIAEGVRQNDALAYLGPVKSRSNLCVSIDSTVSKILITNGVATGVEMVDSKGDTYVIYANKEVILSAGAINSPKLLKLSGVGPKTELEELGIDVVSDLPVGDNMQDHPCALLVYQMEASTETVPASNPHVYPVPAQIGYVALDSTQTHPDYQAIGLMFPHDTAAQMQINSIVFGYNNDVCDKFYAASAGRTTYVVTIQVSKPASRGNVTLASKDYTVDPIIQLGMLSNSSDLTLLAKSLENFNEIVKTSYFSSVNATLVDVGLCSSSSSDFWECYALKMSASMNHFGGTCAMGTVVDSSLRVIGVDGLRVVDASVMPTIPSNEIKAAVNAVAEKAAELILADC